MMEGRTIRVLIGMVGVCLALACQSATAAVIVEELLVSQSGGDGLLESLVGEVLAVGAMAGASEYGDSGGLGRTDQRAGAAQRGGTPR
ncbi:MAG: hypothetical protein ABIK89_13590 [Planctomycetota bacterium]